MDYITPQFFYENYKKDTLGNLVFENISRQISYKLVGDENKVVDMIRDYELDLEGLCKHTIEPKSIFTKPFRFLLGIPDFLLNPEDILSICVFGSILNQYSNESHFPSDLDVMVISKIAGINGKMISPMTEVITVDDPSGGYVDPYFDPYYNASVISQGGFPNLDLKKRKKQLSFTHQ